MRAVDVDERVDFVIGVLDFRDGWRAPVGMWLDGVLFVLHGRARVRGRRRSSE